MSFGRRDLGRSLTLTEMTKLPWFLISNGAGTLCGKMPHGVALMQSSQSLNDAGSRFAK